MSSAENNKDAEEETLTMKDPKFNFHDDEDDDDETLSQKQKSNSPSKIPNDIPSHTTQTSTSISTAAESTIVKAQTLEYSNKLEGNGVTIQQQADDGQKQVSKQQEDEEISATLHTKLIDINLSPNSRVTINRELSNSYFVSGVGGEIGNNSVVPNIVDSDATTSQLLYLQQTTKSKNNSESKEDREEIVASEEEDDNDGIEANGSNARNAKQSESQSGTSGNLVQPFSPNHPDPKALQEEFTKTIALIKSLPKSTGNQSNERDTIIGEANNAKVQAKNEEKQNEQGNKQEIEQQQQQQQQQQSQSQQQQENNEINIEQDEQEEEEGEEGEVMIGVKSDFEKQQVSPSMQQYQLSANIAGMSPQNDTVYVAQHEKTATLRVVKIQDGIATLMNDEYISASIPLLFLPNDVALGSVIRLYSDRDVYPEQAARSAVVEMQKAILSDPMFFL